MEFVIREMRKEEYPLLEEFLYQAIFIPEGEEPLPRCVLNEPELQIYIKDFGSSPHDCALVAETAGEIAACSWVRIMNDYGHVDDETPSLSISVLEEYRGRGIGRKLLAAIIDLQREKGYKGISLSVQKANYAVELYRSLGFKVVEDKEDEYIMVCPL